MYSYLGRQDRLLGFEMNLFKLFHLFIQQGRGWEDVKISSLGVISIYLNPLIKGLDKKMIIC